jgi:hypothetical protein
MALEVGFHPARRSLTTLSAASLQTCVVLNCRREQYPMAPRLRQVLAYVCDSLD